MMRKMLALAAGAAMLLGGGASAQQQARPAAEVVQWDFEDADISTWRCKDNAQIAVVDEGGERGKVLELRTTYGEYTFAWTTNFCEKMDFSDIGAVEYMLRGDSSGARVRVTLGVLVPGERSVYYPMSADAVTLDFTGWRQCRAELPHMSVAAGRDVLADLADVAFVQFFIENAAQAPATTLAIDDVRAVPPTPEEARDVEQWRATMAKLSGPALKDGSNILPNGSFELSPGGEQPQFWTPNEWGTGSKLRYLTDGGHEGARAVEIGCAEATQRGGWRISVSPEPGPYVFSAWAKADTPAAPVSNGPVARLILFGGEGTGSSNIYVRGDPAETGWQLMEKRFEVLPSTKKLQIELFNWFAAGTVRWDDVALAWDVEQAARRERERQQSLADLKEVGPMLEQARSELEKLTLRLQQPEQWDTEAKLLVAMLEWALSDAQLAVEAEMGTNAKATLESALDYIARADEVLRGARAAQRPPAEDPEADANPYIASLNEQIDRFAVEPTVYKKGEEGYYQIENAWSFRGLGDSCCTMAWGLTNPRSKLYADAALVKNLFATIQCVLENQRNGDWNPGRKAIYGADPNIPRFTLGPTFDAYYQLTTRFPWLLLPAKQKEWLDEIRVCVEHQYEEYGLKTFATGAGAAGNYPNQDVYHILHMELAHRVFGDQKYADQVKLFLDFLEATIFPMGGMIYHGTQNECFTYHNLDIVMIARYLEYTGSDQARRIIEKTVEYYPLMVEPSGRVEGYTDPSWKHYQARVSPNAPDIVAALTGDKRNKRCANIALEHGKPGGGMHAVFAAPWWKEMPDEPLADNYILFDENVQAPRARFGPFSFAANARDFGPGQIGKDTFIGCLFSPVGGAQEDEASLLVATSEFRLKREGIHWRNARFVSGEEKFSQVMTDDFFSLAVTYRLTVPRHGGKSRTLPWEGTQEWFASANRLVGLLHITALEDYEAAGIWGRLRFGQKLEMEKGPGDFYKYGPLLARIHAHNYATISTEPSEIFYLDVPEKFKGSEIILRDAESTAEGAPELITYPAGTDHYFLAEVLPYTSALADDVRPIEAEGVRGFSFAEGKVGWIVVHNLTDRAQTYEAEVPPNAECVLYAGLDAGRGEARQARAGKVAVELSAHRHAVLRVVEP